MGRPLNKKFFNPVPDSNGEGVASVTVTGQGNYNTLPTISFSPPALAGGVTATGSVIMELNTVAVNAGGTGYAVGNVLTIGFTADTTTGTFTSEAQIVVQTVSSGVITAFNTLSVRGAYSVLPQKIAGGSNTTNLRVTGGTGTGATVNVTYRVKEVSITNAGSGYVSVSDAAPTFSAGTSTATGNSVLTTSGTNVILARAFVRGGTQALEADIIKQTSTNEYVMVTTEGQSVVTLVANASPTEGQARIQATDALGSTYYVTKLTARLAQIQQWTDGGSGFVYTSGSTAPWSFDISGDTRGLQVRIESA